MSWALLEPIAQVPTLFWDQTTFILRPKVWITEWKMQRKLQVSWTPSSLPFCLLVREPALPTAGT